MLRSGQQNQYSSKIQSITCFEEPHNFFMQRKILFRHNYSVIETRSVNIRLFQSWPPALKATSVCKWYPLAVSLGFPTRVRWYLYYNHPDLQTVRSVYHGLCSHFLLFLPSSHTSSAAVFKFSFLFPKRRQFKSKGQRTGRRGRQAKWEENSNKSTEMAKSLSLTRYGALPVSNGCQPPFAHLSNPLNCVNRVVCNN